MSCKQEKTQLQDIAGKQVVIDSTNVAVDSIRKWITPYKKSVDDVLDAPLAYSPRALSKNDGAKNTSMG
ncbi:MAG: hypothetical protein AAGL29_14795, partial [Bacteroidota bacterium]